MLLRQIGYSAVLAIALGVVAAGGAFAQEGPAEVPGPDYLGNEYIDSAGCSFIRLTINGDVRWTARLDASRQPLCGFDQAMNAAAHAEAEAALAAAEAETGMEAAAETEMAEAADIAEPEMVETDLTAPEMAEVDMAEPETVAPEMADVDMAETELTEPEMAETDMAETDMVAPEMSADTDMAMAEDETAGEAEDATELAEAATDETSDAAEPGLSEQMASALPDLGGTPDPALTPVDASSDPAMVPITPVRAPMPQITTTATQAPQPRFVRPPQPAAAAPAPRPAPALPPGTLTRADVCEGRSGILRDYRVRATGEFVDCGSAPASAPTAAPSPTPAEGRRVALTVLCEEMAQTGVRYIYRDSGQPVDCGAAPVRVSVPAPTPAPAPSPAPAPATTGGAYGCTDVMAEYLTGGANGNPACGFEARGEAIMARVLEERIRAREAEARSQGGVVARGPQPTPLPRYLSPFADPRAGAALGLAPAPGY